MLNKNKLFLGMAIASLTSLVSMASHAALDGFYVGGQVGWGNIHQNNVTRADMMEFLTPAFGTRNYSITHFSNSGGDTGWAGRLYGGYQFNSTWAGEFGWSKFATMNIKGTALGVNNNTTLPYTAKASGSISTSAFDLVAKGTVIMPYDLSFYAKLGLAYLMQTAHTHAKIMSGGSNLSGRDNDKSNRVYPTFGFGFGYDITPHVVTDISWNRIQQVGGGNVASTDLVSWGLNYHFG